MKLPVIIIIVMILISLLLAIGWIINIVKFCMLDFDEPYKAEILRGVGIPFAPLGGVIGWINIDDRPVLPGPLKN